MIIQTSFGKVQNHSVCCLANEVLVYKYMYEKNIHHAKMKKCNGFSVFLWVFGNELYVADGTKKRRKEATTKIDIFVA